MVMSTNSSVPFILFYKIGLIGTTTSIGYPKAGSLIRRVLEPDGSVSGLIRRKFKDQKRMTHAAVVIDELSISIPTVDGVLGQS